MEYSSFIYLVDHDFKRRAAISHTLSGIGIHVEPFEVASDISWESHRPGTILAEDSPGTIKTLVEGMADTSSWMPIIAFSVQPTTQDVAHAIRCGAADYLQWPWDLSAIGCVLSGARINDAALGNIKLREARARSRILRLTKREREVLDGVAHGLSNRKIGVRLAISIRTVEVHRANMLLKIGARHSSDAIRIAFEASMSG